jgi:hypothetical protein
MPESRLPLIRLHCVNASLALFHERQAGLTTPDMERAARLIDEALTLLDASRPGRDVRPPLPQDWHA